MKIIQQPDILSFAGNMNDFVIEDVAKSLVFKLSVEGKLNKGDYAKLEDTLAEAVKDGADVRLKVEPVYEGDAVRPTEFRVSYSIDGEKDVIVFKNRSGD